MVSSEKNDATSEADRWILLLKDVKSVRQLDTVPFKPKNLMDVAERGPPPRAARGGIEEVRLALGRLELEETCSAWWSEEFSAWKDQFVDQGLSVDLAMPYSQSGPTSVKAKFASHKDGGVTAACAISGKEQTPLAPRGPGYPPLCVAAQAGRPGMVALLLACGASINQKSENELGATALHLAAAGGHVHVGRILVSAGADTKAKDNRGRTATQVAVKQGFPEFLACSQCSCEDWRQMAGWGHTARFVLCPADNVAPDDVPALLEIFTAASARWEECVGRPMFTVVSSREEAKKNAAHSDSAHVIPVAYGEWNTKNGYTAPRVRPNRWPYLRCGASIMLRKRRPEEVAPRSVEEATVATACHELGHVLGLPHHPVEGELMHFLGQPTVSNGSGNGFGEDCATAGRWLYRPDMPQSALKRGYPCLCMKCYAPTWWSVTLRGEFRRVDAAEFLSKAKPKRNPHTRRRMETLPDGTSKLVTEPSEPGEEDEAGAEEDAGAGFEEMAVRIGQKPVAVRRVVGLS